MLCLRASLLLVKGEIAVHCKFLSSSCGHHYSIGYNEGVSNRRQTR